MRVASVATLGGGVRAERIDHQERLLTLARSRAPLRRALAAIAGRIVSTRSWERIGFARLADYARERVGLSARQVQDLAHVDGRLATLSGVEAALVGGALSWTKARLLARVATAEDEARWIAYARRVTTHELEREVRALDRGSVEAGGLELDEDGRSTWPTEGVVVRCSPVVQAKFHRVRQVARRVTGEAMPTWACLEAVAAEVLSALPDAAGATGEDEALHTGRVRVANACATQGLPSDLDLSRVAPSPVVTEIPPHVRALLAGLDTADPFELDTRLRQAVALAQHIDAEMAPLLRRLPQLGERAGLSPRKVRALVRLDRASERCPALREAFEEARLSWVQANALVGLLSLPDAAPFRDAWVAWAERVTVRRLHEDVDAALEAAARGEPPAPPDDPSWQTRAQDTGEEETPGGADETTRFFFSAPRDIARLCRAVVCSVRRRLACSQGAAWGWMFDHALEAWGANDPRVRREHRVFARDGWRCTVPGCSSYRNLHDHHIVFRSVGGDDELANRTTLCAYHHLRGVHAGRVHVIGSAPAGLRFELGLRAGQRPLLRYRSGERLDAPAA
jgi:hypothetical protein